jgi:L-threonylcarbamoyladenylate synthase
MAQEPMSRSEGPDPDRAPAGAPTAHEPARIAVAELDDPRDAVHRAVACLAQGGLVGLPTDTGYAPVASALHRGAVERLASIGGEPGAIVLAVRSAAEAEDWAPGLSTLARRLARRTWPGPVTLELVDGVEHGLARYLPEPARRAAASDSLVRLRQPRGDLVREVLGLTSGPILLVEGVGTADAGQAAASMAGSVDMLLDDGPAPPRIATRVRIEGETWSTARPGVVDERSLRRLASTAILFVCTGNTCRSPMAEALCRARLARRLGCRPDELEQRGFLVASAGLAAARDARAAEDARAIVAEQGGSLAQHLSQPLTCELVAYADRIVAMTSDHLDAILDQYPDASDRVCLLDPNADIHDPIGCGREVYRVTAAQIGEALDRFLDSLRPCNMPSTRAQSRSHPGE